MSKSKQKFELGSGSFAKVAGIVVALSTALTLTACSSSSKDPTAGNSLETGGPPAQSAPNEPEAPATEPARRWPAGLDASVRTFVANHEAKERPDLSALADHAGRVETVASASHTPAFETSNKVLDIPGLGTTPVPIVSSIASSSYDWRWPATASYDGDTATFWMTAGNSLHEGKDYTPWIQYTFDQVHSLGTMRVINFDGYEYLRGAKDVEVLVSQDGTSFTSLGYQLFSLGSATTIDGTLIAQGATWQSFDLGGVSAKAVKLAIHTNYYGWTFYGSPDLDGGTWGWANASITGLREVQFDAPCVPNCAGKPCGGDGCGGTCGQLCTGQGCVLSSDCQAGLACTGVAWDGTAPSVCQPPGYASTCANGVQDSNETGVDCGGSCAACTMTGLGYACTGNDDCGSDLSCTPDSICACKSDCASSGGDCGVAQETSLVGAVPGNISVNDSGQMAYSVPLRVPVGPGGLEPQLSLEYRSTITNGPLGAGWIIGGLSTIKRCPKTVGQDGQAGPIEDDADDRFCLDGARLVAIDGDYGADGTEYRTEMDSFQRIVSHGDPGSGASYGGPTTFEVLTPGGRILTYGESQAVETNGAGVRRTWALSSIRDRHDNSITIAYLNQDCSSTPCVDSVLVPSEVRYGTRVVRFVYESRFDGMTRYLHGTPLVLRQRVVRIEMTVDGATVWNYRFDYGFDFTATMLGTVRECVGDTENCKPPTQLAYYGYNNVSDVEPMTARAGISFGNGLYAGEVGSTLVLDLNGDGRDDVLTPRYEQPGAQGGYLFDYAILLGQPKGSAQPFQDPLTTTLRSGLFGLTEPIFPCFSSDAVIDINHDGKDDLLDQCPKSPARAPSRWSVFESTGTDLVRTPLSFLPGALPGFENTEAGSSLDERIWAADLDGDGWKDIILCRQVDPAASPDNSELSLYRNLGATQGFAPAQPLPKLGKGCHVSPYFVDIDGDGVVNMFRPALDPYHETLYHNTPFNPVQPWKYLVLEGSSAHWVDAGLTIQYPPLEDPNNNSPDDPKFSLQWQASVSSTSFIDVTYLSSPLASAWQLKPIDYNGDGLVDFLNYEATPSSPDQQFTLFVNTGHGFTRVLDALKGDPAWYSHDPNYAFYRGLVVDYNRDGRQDFIMPVGSGQDASSIQWVAYESVDSNGPFSAKLVDNTLLHGAAGNLDQFSSPVLVDHDGNGDTEFMLGQPFPVSADGVMNGVPLRLIESHAFDSSFAGLIMDGIGHSYQISYEGAPYLSSTAEDGACPDQVLCLERVAPVVANVTEHMRGFADDTRQYDYSYSRAHEGLFGRGSLGFGSILTTTHYFKADPAGNDLLLKDKRWFDNETFVDTLAGTNTTRFYPYAGHSIHHKTTHDPWQDVSGQPAAERDDESTVTEKELLVSTDGQPFVNLKTTVSTQAPSHVQKETTTTLDGYGNLVNETMKWTNYAQQVLETRTTSTPIEIKPAMRSAWLIRGADSNTVKSETDGGTTTHGESMTYFANGDLKHQTVTISAPNRPNLQLSTDYTYDSFGNFQSITRTDQDGVQRVKSYVFDPTGVVPIQASDGDLTSYYSYDLAHGGLLRVTDPNGLSSGQGYDGFGRVNRVFGPNQSTVIAFDTPPAQTSSGSSIPNLLVSGAFRVTTTTTGGDGSIGGAVSTQTYDSLGRLLQAQSKGYFGELVDQEFEYDAADRLIYETNPHPENDTFYGHIAYNYNSLNRIQDVTRSAEQTGLGQTTYRYGGVTADTLPDGWPALDAYAAKHAAEIVHVEDTRLHVDSPSVSQQVLGRFGEALVIQDPGQGVTRYRQEAFGRLASITDDSGNVTTLKHDSLGKRTTLIDPDQGTEEITYTAFGEPASVQNPAGTHAYQYDGLGRLAERADGSGRRTEYRYDTPGLSAQGKLTSAWTEDGAGNVLAKTEYGYVSCGNGAGEIGSIMRTVGDSKLKTQLDYDAAGRLATIQYPSPGSERTFRVAYDYDDIGHMIGVHDDVSGAPIWSLQTSNKGFRVGTELFGNGVTSTWTYKPTTGLVDEVRTFPASGADPIQALSYSYDSHGNVLKRLDAVHPGESRSYVYDPLDRLTDEKQLVGTNETLLEHFDFDKVGNIRSRTSVGDYKYAESLSTCARAAGPHAVSSAGGNSYCYDARGNQVTRSGPGVVGGEQHIEYTQLGLPTTVHDGSDDTLAEFTYDAGDNRVRMQTDDLDIVYGGDLYEERRKGTTTQYHYRVFANGREVAQVEWQREGAGSLSDVAVRYLHADALGSTDLITNENGETVHPEFDAFGTLDNASVDDTELSSGFTGHRHHGALGLVDMKGRLYDSTLGRFISPDPIITSPFFSEALNRYSYAFNNPLKFVDPNGLFPTCASESGSKDFGGYQVIWSCPGASDSTPSWGSATPQNGSPDPLSGVVRELRMLQAARRALPGAQPGGTSGHSGSLSAGPAEEDPEIEDFEKDVEEEEEERAAEAEGMRSAGPGLRLPVPRVRMARVPVERLPEGDARVTSQGDVWLVPRNARPPARDPVGDRMAEIASEARQSFRPSWLQRWQIRELTWRKYFTPARFDSLYRMWAGQAIEREVRVQAGLDPVTAGVQFVGSKRPGPDFRGGSGIYYELTTVQQLSAHLGRAGMRPANGSVRFLLYPGL